MIVEEEKIRIDKYLSDKLDISRSKIQKLIKEGKVLVNGEEISSNYLTHLNDSVEIIDDLNFEIEIVKENIPLDIVYEDEYLLIVNKKSGMVVHPAPGNYTSTLVNALLYRFDMSGMDKVRPGIVHRLDKDTSGVMVVAKDEKTHELLSEMIKNKEVQRVYLALVDGIINHETGTIDAPIGRDTVNRQKMMVTDVNSKDAITHFKVLKRYSKNTLIECVLDTGRTHQIRVHMSEIGYPVVGDMVYSNGKNEFGVEGQMLHAKSLDFKHPITEKQMHLEAELPNYFKEVIAKLQK